MATITKDKLQEILKNKPSGASDETVIKSIINRGHTIEGLELPSQKIEQEKLQPNRGQRIENVINEAGQTVRQNILGEGEFEGQTPLRRGTQATAAAFSAVPQTAIAAAPESVRNVAGQLGDFVSKGFNKLINFIGDSPELQNFTKENPDVAKAIEEVAGTLGAGGEIAANILGAREIVRGTERSINLTDDVLRSTFQKSDTPSGQITPQTVKVVADQAPEPIRQKAVTDMAETYKNSLLSTKSATQQIERIARERGIEVDDVLREFVDKRGLPSKVTDEGRISFDSAIRDFESRQDTIGGAISTFLKTKVEQTPINQLKNKTVSQLREVGEAAELTKSLAEVDRIFESFKKKYGDNLTAEQVNDIRVEMNKSFRENSFEVDARTAIGNATRNRIDEIVGDERIRRINQEWGDLEQQIKIAKILDQQKVDVGLLGNSLGSYIAAVGLGSAGLAAGSGSLVIAGLVSQFGGKTFANWLRRRKINDPEVQEVLKAVRQDEALVKQLLKDADEATKAQLESLLLPEPGKTSVIELPAAELGRGPNSRIISGDNQ